MLNLKFTVAANGVLRIHPTNSRYFTDDTGKAIYFAGSHTWGVVFPTRVVPYDNAYRHPTNYNTFENFLDFLQSHNHNFTRLWTGTSYLTAGKWPWLRTGPGIAFDGKPKFDLNRFNQNYFDILKQRVRQIEDRHMYASVMIFGSHNKFDINYKCISWHPDNNINELGFNNGYSFFSPNDAGIDTQRLVVRKFIDTLNEFDNIIFEVINEAPFPESAQWQKDIISYAKHYEAQKPKQHLWGITADYKNSNPHLISGIHDWWSPDTTLTEGYDYRQGGPASYSSKPVIVDSDHFDGGLYKSTEIRKGIALVWKTFTRGNHPILMECYDDNWVGLEFGCNSQVNHVFDPIRNALGHTRSYANRLLDLAKTKPNEGICSTKYCLVNPGEDYIIYQPVPQDKCHACPLVSEIRQLSKNLILGRGRRGVKAFTVYLEKGRYKIEWFDPYDESLSEDMIEVPNESWLRFRKPPHIKKDAVLYLKRVREITKN